MARNRITGRETQKNAGIYAGTVRSGRSRDIEFSTDVKNRFLNMRI